MADTWQDSVDHENKDIDPSVVSNYHLKTCLSSVSELITSDSILADDIKFHLEQII